MAVEFWLYPGVLMNVQAPMKVSMVPIVPGEIPPVGTTVIPPQALPQTMPPLTQTIASAVAANLETARQGSEAAEALTNQQTVEAQAAFNAALAKSNEEAAKLHAAQQALAGQTPPWSVTFTEQR